MLSTNSQLILTVSAINFINIIALPLKHIWNCSLCVWMLPFWVYAFSMFRRSIYEYIFSLRFIASLKDMQHKGRVGQLSIVTRKTISLTEDGLFWTIMSIYSQYSYLLPARPWSRPADPPLGFNAIFYFLTGLDNIRLIRRQVWLVYWLPKKIYICALSYVKAALTCQPTHFND